jgi:transcriptional regulator with XRE-family HTH domain
MPNAIVIGSADTLEPMGKLRGKSFDPTRNERLRGIVATVVRERFKNNVTAAAEKFGVSQPLLSEFLAGGRGAGPKLLEGVADFTGYSLDFLYDRVPTPFAVVSGVSRAQVRDNPQWAPAVEEAKRRRPGRLPDYAYAFAAETSGARAPKHIGWEDAYQLADFWFNTVGEEELARAETDAARAEMAAEDAEVEAQLRKDAPANEPAPKRGKRGGGGAKG